MTWPFPNMVVIAQDGGGYGGPDDLYTGATTFEAQPVGRQLIAFVQIRAPMVNVTPGWTAIAIDRDLSSSEESDVGIFTKRSTGLETSFSVDGAHAEAVDGWTLIILSLTGVGVVAGPDETDPGAPTFPIDVPGLASVGNVGLWMVSYSTAVTVGPFLDGDTDTDTVIASAAGGADVDATRLLARRVDGALPATTITANGGMFGVEALGLSLAFNGWLVNMVSLG